MSLVPPTADPRTIEAYARSLVGKERDAKHSGSRVLALAASPVYHGPLRMEVDGAEVTVHPCQSALAVREALVGLPDGGFAIVLTDRPVDDLGDSLVARFRRQRVEPLDPWTTVPGMFAGTHLDDGMRHTMPWLPDLLFEWMPPGGYPPSATQQVTRDHILASVTGLVLGIPGDEIGLGSLLERLGDLRVRVAWSELPQEARASIGLWAGQRAGQAAGAVLDLAASPSTAHVHVLALGLMLDVLYGEPATLADVVQARHGWEAGYRLPRIGAAEAAQIGAAARSRMRVLTTIDPSARHDVWRDTPEAFAVAGFPTGIAHSPSHPDGYRSRLSEVAGRLVAVLHGATAGALEEAATRLQAHDLAWSDRAGDTEQVSMALRLVRWLGSDRGTPPADLAAALARQATVDGWVDRAVADVWSGSTHPDVAAAYRDLCHAVLTARRDHDRQFAALLAEATARDVLPVDVLPVERVLAGVVEPLTRAAPVLLIVVDGMSTAVAAAVGEGISRLSWVEHVPAHDRPGRAAVLAALPTMTRYSRTSLLSGDLREGAAADEKRAFTALTGGRLFHKDDLRAPAGAAVNPEVAAAIASSTKVVGVVLNTVDDTLAKHDPDGTRWSVGAIQHLAPLLEVANEHGRTVVITADHGHVVERGGRADPRPLADTRWRPASTGPAGADEVLLTGPRVLAAGGAVVAPWVEDLRYGHKAAGYHGGASAAEVTIPLLVLAGSGTDLTGAGWQPAGEQAPPWWDSPTDPVPGAKPRRRPRPSVAQDSEPLFDLEPPPTPPADPAHARRAAAVEACLSSPVYQRTRAAAGRAALPDATVGQVLRVLLDGGGRASGEHVARALGVHVSRLAMPLAGLKRLLNVEGYQVVSMDADGRTVVLDEALWRQQFGIDR